MAKTKVTKTIKTNKPTGLGVTRDGNNFKCSWKIGDKNYGDGQALEWRYRYTSVTWVKATNTYGNKVDAPVPAGVSTSSWHGVSISKTATSKTIKLDLSGFYPTVSTKMLTCFEFRVRGNRETYKVTGKKTVTTYKPEVSAWSTYEFVIENPAKPTISITNGTWPSLSAAISAAASGTAPRAGIQYQSVLVKNSTETDGVKINWNSALLPKYSSYASGGSYTLSVTEDSGQLNDGNSYTRWVRARAKGAGGISEWTYAKHVYALSYKPTITSASATDEGLDYLVKMYIENQKNAARPITQIRAEWCIETPTATMGVPGGASWTTGQTVKPLDKTSGAVFRVDTQVSTDECLFVRAVAEYDGQDSPGEAYRVLTGSMAAPTGLSATPGVDYKISVGATNASTVPGSFMVVRFYDAANPNGIDVGILDSSPKTIQCPEYDDSNNIVIGVYAAAGSYTSKTRADGVTVYEVDAKMTSAVTKTGGTIPAAPASVTVNAGANPGTIRVAWSWTWGDATSAELSWADHDDAWESTEEPQTYIVDKSRGSAWNISNLETGKKWYVRVRLLSGTDEITYGAYSGIQEINLSSAPMIPVLQLDKSIITTDGEVTASWGYATTDGTMQAQAEVADVTTNYILEYELTSDVTVQPNKTYYTRSGSGTELDPYVYTEVDTPVDADLGTYYEVVGSTPGVFTYSIITTTLTEQSVTISAAEQGWNVGETHQIAVRVVSGSGMLSDDWSEPVPVTIAPAVTCTIDSTSLTTVTQTTTDQEGTTVTNTYTALDALPLTATILGAGVSGTTTLVIERANGYTIDRPDEEGQTCYEGETVALLTQVGEDPFSIGLDNLIGSLDDGAWYRLIATVQDGYGQSASASIEFIVAWAHQAEAPTATAVIQDGVSFLTPIAPDNYVVGDKCDIYRLSADKPELVYKNADFGTTYVDPYPTIGEYGGHRFVTITKDGDYITADNTLAWYDTNDQFDVPYNIIEFGTGRALLTFDVELSNEWTKDFEQTSYLGGSVVGDWNKAVVRNATLTATAVAAINGDTVETMRRLATWSGICHVRTKDGSSYAANVEVGDKFNYASGVRTTDYSLKITRIQPETYDGLTLTEWQKTEDESES